MADSSHVVLVTQTRVRQDQNVLFQEWLKKMSSVVAGFPGHVGTEIQQSNPPLQLDWVIVQYFVSTAAAEAWLQSSERQKLFAELDAFAGSHSDKVYSGFNFWFTNKGSARSVWKENMLVLLTLYPVVFLLSYIQNPVMKHGMPFWLALFFSNLASTVILGSLTVPWLMGKFQWWLNPPPGAEKKNTILGIIVVLLLYVAALAACWLTQYS